jgi:hypothetical protein
MRTHRGPEKIKCKGKEEEEEEKATNLIFINSVLDRSSSRKEF